MIIRDGDILVDSESTYRAPTLAELREKLEGHGVAVAIGTLWRFFKRRNIMRKKDGVRPIRIEARTKLLAAIAKGRRWLDDIISGEAVDVEVIAARECLSERSARMILSLAFLAPDIVKAAVNGTLRRGFGVSRLTNLPTNWADQRRALGLAMTS
jgi:hypothetical protein